MTPCFFNSGAAFLWGGSSTETVLRYLSARLMEIEKSHFSLVKKTPEDSLKNKQLGHLQISPSIQKMRLAILFKFEIMRKNICKNESVEERTSSDRFKNRMDGQHLISFSTRSSHFQPLSWLLGSQLYQQDGKFNLFPLKKYKHRQIGCQDFHCYARLLEDIHC